MDKFKIYHIDENGNSITDLPFEAESRDEAYEQLNKFKAEHLDDGNEYFYGFREHHILRNDDGTKVAFDSMRELMNYKHTPKNTFEKVKQIWDDIVFWFDSKLDRFRQIKYAYDDIVFWWKHYNSHNGTSHMRSEVYSIDHHVLDDLVFNINLLQEELHGRCGGVPTEWCEKAREQLKSADPAYVVPDDVINSWSYTDNEMNIASELWCNELDNFLRMIGMYRFYCSYGFFSDDEYKMHRMNKSKEEYEKLIPRYPGTKDDIIYTELNELTQNAWNDIWKWYTKYGQMLWT